MERRQGRSMDLARRTSFRDVLCNRDMGWKVPIAPAEIEAKAWGPIRSNTGSHVCGRDIRSD